MLKTHEQTQDTHINTHRFNYVKHNKPVKVQTKNTNELTKQIQVHTYTNKTKKH